MNESPRKVEGYGENLSPLGKIRKAIAESPERLERELRDTHDLNSLLACFNTSVFGVIKSAIQVYGIKIKDLNIEGVLMDRLNVIIADANEVKTAEEITPKVEISEEIQRQTKAYLLEEIRKLLDLLPEE